LAVLFRTRNTTRTVDIALIAVRIALAWIFFVYGAQKLFGWFDGAGLDGTANFMANTAGLKPGKFFAVMGGLIEFGGAIALAFYGVPRGTRDLRRHGDGDDHRHLVQRTLYQTNPPATPGYQLNVALADCSRRSSAGRRPIQR
jgi:hypothetical protein